MREHEPSPNMQTVHKVEATASITADKADREEVRHKLNLCINPLSPEQHPEGISDIVNGSTAPSSENVDKPIEIDTRQMEEFKRKLPQRFHDITPKKIQTMAVTEV